jgi:hypothetical protein
MDDVIEALTQAEEYFDNHSDVLDGDYGVPEPNKEMRLAQLCRDALAALSPRCEPLEGAADAINGIRKDLAEIAATTCCSARAKHVTRVNGRA